ncbi:MAG TPA: hypothetical protein VIM20_10550, partial [Candidatus Limnocylindrales bacterium]
MIASNVRSPRLLAGALTVLLIVAGCTGSAAAPVSPSPTASPNAAATPSPARSLSPSPVPSYPTPTRAPASSTPALDAASGLKIGSPFRLVANPANSTLTASFSFNVATVHVEETMTGREVWQRNKLVGLAYIIEISGVQMSRTMFDRAAKGAANATQGNLTFTTILGNRVAFIATKAASFG